jgi:septal ring factor EnvC (AmiA/AmiB activator)
VGEQTLQELTQSMAQSQNVWEVLQQPEPLLAEELAPIPTKKAAAMLEAQARAETLSPGPMQ